ncbi:unnamed protein product (macronuclear) [Paramecium tetraurelia]|uniref:BZIP domain-containing protein n=1 Tax=Paramecium tetraurelia TaxID=5888 RepID=A0BZI9_PARTE|nr:uncharacterized protein GSPATT00033809001 [Paramecium tetraurelia]CAK63956.1 unnamed protein product [Paramecium tetraurelia]|eukprot:XP_001431354.1 hypothetical protein (macronuclear) [Paramecium tetraurelia strain d4-2]
MSDFFMPNRSEIAQYFQSGLGNLQDKYTFLLFISLCSNFGPYGGGSLIQNSGFLVQPDQYCSSVGLEESATPIQIYEFHEPEFQKPILFRSSGNLEMQSEEFGIDRLNCQVKTLEDFKEYKNPLQDSGFRSNEPSFQEFNIYISNLLDSLSYLESEQQINSQFKPDITYFDNQNIISENKSLFNVNQAKSIYKKKITLLADQTQKKIDLTIKTSSRQTKNQIKLQRKSSIIPNDQIEMQSCQMTGDENIDSVQQKLAKNRESARNSRARKKLYYELLETKVKELQEEIQRLKESNQARICNKIEENFQTFLEQQQQLFDKLETCLLKNKENFEIEIILDALRYRTNSNIQERKDAARQYCESMIEAYLPIQTKYLIYSLENNKDFFALQSEDYTDWMKETFKKLQIQPDQIKKVRRIKSKLQSVTNNISEYNYTFKFSSIQKIQDQLKVIQSEAIQVDLMWEQLKEHLTPVQLGKCILTMKQNSFRQELKTSSLFPQLKNHQLREEDKIIQRQDQSPIPKNRKRIKQTIQ